MLTPSEIQSREFLVSLRGYDRDEVHAFLDEVAEEFGKLLQQAGSAPAEEAASPRSKATEPAVAAEPAAAPTSSFAAIGAETQRILEAAAEAGEEIRRRAQAEADGLRDEVINDAQAEVDALTVEAETIRQQIADLTARRDDLGNRLRQIRERVDLALLEIEEAAPEEPADASTSVLAAAKEAEEADGGSEDDEEPTGEAAADDAEQTESAEAEEDAGAAS